MYGDLVQICFCSWDSKMQDIPASDSFPNWQRKGFLQKLTGRGWLYSGTWKKRYCILHGSKFYYYEKEQSKGNEKSCGVLNLDYYDVCGENSPRDKKNPHVFFIGTSIKGFFDNRHQFAAETAEDLHRWIEAIQLAIAEARHSRRRKQHHPHSPDLDSSTQEADGTTGYLLNANKDRVRGPQGRRLPQRKSMMPASRSVEEEIDIRQRSVSLSGPEKSDEIEDSPPPDGKWLSLSMEEVDREKGEIMEEGQRSSSAFDIPQQKEVPEIVPAYKKAGARAGILGQHAALTKELEMRLKAGMAPGARRLPHPEDYEERNNGKKADDDAVRNEGAPSQVGDTLLQVTIALQEVERIKAEYKQALTEVHQAKNEYQHLVRECKETLAKLNTRAESQQNGA